MTYQATLDFLFSQLPMYQRIGAAAYKADLDTTWKLLEALGNPQNGSVKFIHVAGTNGKGSVCHMLASVLQEAGYKTGLFTSPHLKDFRERIRINGEMISKESVVAFVENNRGDFKKIQPSFFEMSAALAFHCFKDANVDIAVLETGMGGRLDSTNVVVPEVSVITNIGLDHTQFLGNTIAAIAGEKAGIIKPERPVVAGPMLPEALSVIREAASSRCSPLSEAKVEQPAPKTDLTGSYQPENVATAIATIGVLIERGFKISDFHIERGLASVVRNTGLLGRWQTLATDPLTICDVGHNVDGMKHVVRQIESTPHQQLHFVLGMVGDKNIDEVLQLLPRDAEYYFCAASIPRAMDAQKLRETGLQQGLKGETYISVPEALQAATAAAKQNDLVFVGGSIFVVAEAL